MIPIKAAMPVALAVEELDTETLEELAVSRMDERHANLDVLMD